MVLHVPGLAVTSVVVVLVVAVMCEATSQTLVPDIPEGITIRDTSLYNLWNHALRNQKDSQGNPLRDQDLDPRTLLSPEHIVLTNLVPQDAPHPLYSNKYADLRTEMLLDYMITETISPDDARMSQSGGLSVTNLNGKNLTFKRDSQGTITVESKGQNNEDVVVTVSRVNNLSDGRVVYTVSDLLFDHRQRVDAAFQVLLRTGPRFGAFGEPLGTGPF